MRLNGMGFCLFIPLLSACSAFDSAPAPQACMDIPEGGCPGSGTDNCTDPTCASIYTCENDGGWSFSAACPVREAGVRDARPDVNLRRDVDFDVPPGATGGMCGDLENPPDCNLSLALACPSDECCGCQNVFVCDDGGWNLWGSCEEVGALVPNAPPGAPDH
jgi:hypothetical protein